MTLAQLDKGVRTYYDAIISRIAGDLHGIDPESFTPRPGFILVVVPPSEEQTKGGVVLPEQVQEARNIARVAAVPSEPSFYESAPKEYSPCPFKPGDTVLFTPGAGLNVNFGDRKDLKLLEYTDDIRSEVIGVLDIEL